jgi:CheY-like chemotaxis protein
VLNLAVNARDAMPGGGDITIGARVEQVRASTAGGLQPGPYVVISVRDTGEGMDQATLDRAMEPFFTTKGVGKGTGLGLSTVHGFAAQSGGRFLLHSRPGAGTVAELWLPRAVPVAALADPAPEPPRKKELASGTVLVVDDDPLVLTTTAAMLEDLGYATLEATDAQDALERVREGAPVDLVITGYAMSGMNGLQLAEELHRIQPQLAILIATGYGEQDVATSDGVARLIKPLRQEALAQAIARCFATTSC